MSLADADEVFTELDGHLGVIDVEKRRECSGHLLYIAQDYND